MQVEAFFSTRQYSTARVVLTGAEIAPEKLKENPHVWYSVRDIHAIAGKIAETFEKLDATDKDEFEQNLKTFDDSLKPIDDERFAVAVQRARKFIESQSKSQIDERILQFLGETPNKYTSRFAVRTGSKIQVVFAEEITAYWSSHPSR